jgi:hypothetical protein
MDSPDTVIALLISIISNEFDSVRTLNILMRTSKSLNAAACDPTVLANVVKNTPAMNKDNLRLLFVLQSRVQMVSFEVPPPFYGRSGRRLCVVEPVFNDAIAIHGGVKEMNIAWHARKRRKARSTVHTASTKQYGPQSRKESRIDIYGFKYEPSHLLWPPRERHLWFVEGSRPRESWSMEAQSRWREVAGGGICVDGKELFRLWRNERGSG